MYSSRLIGAVCACLVFAGNVQANFIVDTGSGGTVVSGNLVNTGQYIAGQFVTTNAYTLTSIEGWFGKLTEGTLTAAIYTDNGSGIPISELFAAQFTLDIPGGGPATQAWDGAFGLNWILSPGTYWLAFEGRSGDTGAGYMPTGTNGAPNPLPNYAHYDPTALQWTTQLSSRAYGMRISAIPIPAAFYLFGSGLLGMIGISRRKKAA